ncbi:MAG TPA: nuclear transport factor 2 family protein [Acidimicrobiales bacterium]
MSKASANAALMRRYIETVKGVKEGTADGRDILRFYSPDIRVESTGRSPVAGTFAGRDFYERWLPLWAVYDVTIVELKDLLASDTRVAFLVVEEYRHIESDEVLRVDRISSYEIEDDLITSMTVVDKDQYVADDFWTRTQP